MTPYGKVAQHAVSAVSRLAQVYDPARRVKLNSADIATSRGLPQPVVAKALTVLSQAGLVASTPGPGGGYWLARPPADVSLFDVVSLFERFDQNVSCPFGPDWCGNGPRCPLHNQMLAAREQVAEFLKRTHFGAFVGWDQQAGGPAVPCPAPAAAAPIPLGLVNPPPAPGPAEPARKPRKPAAAK